MSKPRGLQCLAGPIITVYVAAVYPGKVPAQRLKGDRLDLNLARGPVAAPPQNWDRWAPSLDRIWNKNAPTSERHGCEPGSHRWRRVSAPRRLGQVMGEALVLAAGSVLVLFSAFCFAGDVWRELFPGQPLSTLICSWILWPRLRIR